MNRKILAGVAVTAPIFLSLLSAGSGNARGKEVSSTRRFLIDGRSFASDESPFGAGSPLKRELCRLGVGVPDGFALPEESHPPHPALEGRLKESRPQVPEPLRLPAGLNVEHTLRMEGEGAPVDLVFGTLGARGPSIRSRLLSSGWESVSDGGGPGGMCVLRFVRGKEAGIVCLDDSDGTFLLVREVGR